MQFQEWKEKYAPNDSGDDYDLRGAFDAGLTPDANGHWPDIFKRPNHPTFSDQSVFAIGRNASKAGRWEGDRFIRPLHICKHWGELFLDDDGTTHFKFHIEGGDWFAAREALVKFIACLQHKLDSERKCPFYGNRESSI